MKEDETRRAFDAATPLERFSQYIVADYAGSAHAMFGLRDINGNIHRFKADADTLADIAMEVAELARNAKHLQSFGESGSFVSRFTQLPTDDAGIGLVGPFYGPMMKLLRAEFHIEEVDDLTRSFTKRAEVVPFAMEPDGDKDRWRIDISPSLPMALPLSIGDAVHNMRSALDILICDIARLRSVSTDRLKFPFAKSATTFSEVNFEIQKRIGRDVSTAIEALKPFSEGGNVKLIGLHDLDIMDKHRIILPVVRTKWYRYDIEKSINDFAEQEGRQPIKIITVGNGFDSYITQGEIVTSDHGTDPLRYLGHHDLGFSVAFAGPDLPFAGKHILDVLIDLHGTVRDIVLDFGRKFGPPDLDAE